MKYLVFMLCVGCENGMFMPSFDGSNTIDMSYNADMGKVSRLRNRYIAGTSIAVGVKIEENVVYDYEDSLYDTQLNVICAPTKIFSPDNIICLPPYAGISYSDSSCSTLVTYLNTNYVTGAPKGFPTPPTYKVGQSLGMIQAYTKSGTTCTATGGILNYFAATLVPVTTFAIVDLIP